MSPPTVVSTAFFPELCTRMKLTSLGIFLILVGALALCPLLKPHMREGYGTLRAARKDTAHAKGRPHRGHPRRHRPPAPGAYDAIRRRNMAPQPADSLPPPQAEVTGNGYEAPGSSGPQGIPGSEIAPGDEDLYILKSEVVPPVCPACPTNASCPRQKPCPPCPPCARCPEPAFECKKVPNYATNNSQYLPRPVLTDFSQFGT